MQSFSPQPSKTIWVHGRETSPDSYERGDVVVFQINVWSAPGLGIPVVGTVKHGTKVILLDTKRDNKYQDLYFSIRYKDIQGWVSEQCIAYTWSQFIVTGVLTPSEVCKNLEITVNSAGIDLNITKNRFVASTSGAKDHITSVLSAVERMLHKLTVSQAFLSQIPLSYEVISWIEVPITPVDRSGVVGFSSDQAEGRFVKPDDLKLAYNIIAKLPFSPYLELAISDYDQALRHPQHALIFLSRSVESIERYFEQFAKNQKSKGKDKLMQNVLEVTKADVDYVMSRANSGHRRHASSTARPENLPQDELQECYSRTRSIVQAFLDFYSAVGL